jgi:hypothetical protein
VRHLGRITFGVQARPHEPVQARFAKLLMGLNERLGEKIERPKLLDDRKFEIEKRWIRTLGGPWSKLGDDVGCPDWRGGCRGQAGHSAA